MKEDDRASLALVEVSEAEAIDLAVVGRERELREFLEQLIGGAHGVDRHGARL